MTITCKRCSKPKHPALYRPGDVKRSTNICRECRTKELPRRVRKSDQPDYWRESNVRFFGEYLARRAG